MEYRCEGEGGEGERKTKSRKMEAHVDVVSRLELTDVDIERGKEVQV
jgi:hypothetical protein